MFLTISSSTNAGSLIETFAGVKQICSYAQKRNRISRWIDIRSTFRNFWTFMNLMQGWISRIFKGSFHYKFTVVDADYDGRNRNANNWNVWVWILRILALFGIFGLAGFWRKEHILLCFNHIPLYTCYVTSQTAISVIGWGLSSTETGVQWLELFIWIARLLQFPKFQSFPRKEMRDRWGTVKNFDRKKKMSDLVCNSQNG